MVNLFPNQTSNSNSLVPSELSILLDGMDKAAFLVDNEQVVAVNALATELTAFTRHELVDKSFDEVLLFGEQLDGPTDTRNSEKSPPSSKSKICF